MWFLHRHLDSFIMMGQLRIIYRDSATYQLYPNWKTCVRQPGLCKNHMTVHKLKMLNFKTNYRFSVKQITEFQKTKTALIE
jgi:hypothetical protein